MVALSDDFNFDFHLPKRDRSHLLNPYKKIGRNIKSIRADSDVTQGQLVDRMNDWLLSEGAIEIPKRQSVVSLVEDGKRRCHFLEAYAISQALGVAAESLWTGKYDHYRAPLQWRSIEDEMPRQNVEVLVYCPEMGRVAIGFWCPGQRGFEIQDGGFWVLSRSVRYWMNKPLPPV